MNFTPAFVILVTMLLAGCASLPTRPPEPASTSGESIGATRLGHALAPALADHPGLSGVYPLEHGTDAFAARMALAAAAERTLDVQYYIWHPDDTGRLLANELIRAADRGVHVRLLIDDFGTNPSDVRLLALDNHPNIEVRLFNPSANRMFRRLSFFFDFNRTNRRMHNKSFTADHQATIIGGRNIGDEYFGAGPGVEFADFDVVAVGPVVAETETAFDLFWRDPHSIPIAALNRKKVSAESTARQAAELAAECAVLEKTPYLQAVHASRVMKEVQESRLDFSWGRAALVYDLPDKVATAPDDRSTHLTTQLRPVIDATQRDVLIISAYFIPGDEGVEFFKALRQRGVRVVVISNSLAATDVAAVHAGYRRYRKALLRAGVEMYEFKPTAVGRNKAGGEKPSGGSSRASLHAKTFVFDHEKIFVGSLNLDPRSTALNTEIGAVFDVPDLAVRFTDGVEKNITRDAYRLEFVPGPGPCKECGSVTWVSEENGQTTRYTHEPEASWGRRFLVALLSFFPIESQL